MLVVKIKRIRRGVLFQTIPESAICTLPRPSPRYLFEMSFLLFFFIPMTIMLFLYVSMGLKLRRPTPVVYAHSDSSNRSQSRKSILKMLGERAISLKLPLIAWRPSIKTKAITRCYNFCETEEILQNPLNRYKRFGLWGFVKIVYRHNFFQPGGCMGGSRRWQGNHKVFKKYPRSLWH